MAWLSTAQALVTLGVRPQTLYANVSRQKIRTRPDPGDPRRSQYHADDVGRLARRRAGRRRSEAVAADAIGWGDPVLQTQISTIAAGRLWYRGQDAVALAASQTLEQIAALLWDTDAVHPVVPAAQMPQLPQLKGDGAPVQRALLALAALAGSTPAHTRSSADLQRETGSVLHALADALLGPAAAAAPLHQRLAAAFGQPQAAELLRRALVLLADHELNASTFATRVTASTGATLAASVLSGLATLTGPAHGGASGRLFMLVDDVLARGTTDALHRHLEQGRIAAFGHPLYPAGDPRASALLACITLPAGFAEVRTAIEQQTGERPNVDFALAAITRAWQLPADAPLTLFALGRCVGWLAHALEQIATGSLLRPRARYTGPALATAPPPAPALPRPATAGPWNI